MKYWNKQRIQKERDRERKSLERRIEIDRVQRERERIYSPGDSKKNTRLMLDALGSKLRRRMIARLARGGAMSLSKLSGPLGLMLPAALDQIHVLERAGLITTHKRGRIRFCVYRPGSLKELGNILAMQDIAID